VKLIALAALFSTLAPAQWRFAVSGDSRNCGDIVMPAIAAGVKSSGAEFYWHLGDFRAIYASDEDIVPLPPSLADYQSRAWPDFIEHQLGPFGDLPIRLALGNHENVRPATRERALIQFAKWFDAPAIRDQRLKDDPRDHSAHAYYHWMERGVDFITLDNSSQDQFDAAQIQWLTALLKRDEASPEIHTIVAGMHAALPGSFGSNHSMGDWPQGDKTGRQVYEALWSARTKAHKNVYVLASHSHFYMPDVYTTGVWKDKVLPGWIIGTAGAVRYRLPPGAPPAAKTNVYGYMTGTVMADGSISFKFFELSLADVERASPKYAPTLVRWCFEQNHQ
jgi:hypothetical protein